MLSAHLDGFLNSWETAEYPPGIDEHLPGSVGILRRMVLIELIKIDLEYRHRRDVPRLLIEDYRDEFPELADGEGVPSDLIYEEFHVRKNAGESVEVNDYLQRFPEHADQLHRLFQINEPTSSSSLSGTQLHAAHKPGDRLGDFYLMSNLGTGAFGSVFLARQESMQRLVALKVSSDRGAEAQTLAQLDHPHIVRVYDQNRLPDRNLRLLYMQFVPGGTLQAVIEASRHCERPDSRLIASCVASSLSQTGVLSPDAGGHRAGVAARPWPEVVCRLGMELATALDYAHEQGILHRDLKPANVLLDVNGAAKLADFNISYSCHLESRGPAAYFGGSLAYMSPEQLEASHPKHERRPEELDGRSDLFSLGILLWEVLYGRRPFGDESVKGTWSETLLQMATLRRSGAPESPVEAMSPVEKQLVAILRRCMAPDAESRY
ncbi:MAG: serine/threonine-protein kinase, partial [Planctomyces sp.]